MIIETPCHIETLFLFTKPMENVTADEGASASFIVETNGKPKSVKWCV